MDSVFNVPCVFNDALLSGQLNFIAFVSLVMHNDSVISSSMSHGCQFSAHESHVLSKEN